MIQSSLAIHEVRRHDGGSSRDQEATPGRSSGPSGAGSGMTSEDRPPPAAAAARPLLSGHTRLGRYHLIAPLGRGSQGEVWKAVQIEPIVELVALKLLSTGQELEPRRLARLHHEALRGAHLDSPGLLPIYEFGVEHGIAYLAMPWVDGFTLGDVLGHRIQCRVGAPPSNVHRLAILPESQYLSAMVRVLARIARALDAAHSAQVVHRDVKPSNILLDRHCEERAFLVDFGLGRDLDVVTLPQLRTGEGTLRYMAPEKLLGRQVDEVSCDLYALGMTLFEAATLTTPRGVPATLPRAAWAAHLARWEPRPGELHPGLPADLDAIVSRALARDPARRYPSASAMASDLDRFLAGLPEVA
jgi:eukaryotic-like serine/threonine-protein kinase